MSRAAPATKGRTREPVVVESPTSRRAVVRWMIAAEALPERFRPLDSQDDAVLEISITVADGGCDASARLRAGGRERSIELTGRPGAGTWRPDPETGLEHIDLPGAAAITIRRAAGSPPKALYATTPLLSQLGLSGGRYELADLHISGDR